MLSFTINGKMVRPDELRSEFMRVAVEKIEQEMRDRLSSICHPKTGEFLTVVVMGNNLDDMTFRVEGTTELLNIVKERLSPEELGTMTLLPKDAAQIPRAFLSYGCEDRDLAERIARALQANGIKTWWAEWEIKSGDSIRRKIDEGLGDCTHFIVLLTPTSITRPWVNEEIDAGFMRKVSAKSRFMPLRCGLQAEDLPPLMSGIFAPEIDVTASNLLQLVSDIHGHSRKPQLGSSLQAAAVVNTGYSLAATRVAKVFVESSEYGESFHPHLTIGDIANKTDLTEEDLTDALHELRSFIKITNEYVTPKELLFSEFDHYWQPWNPADDALKLAADMVNDHAFPGSPVDIASRYNWSARRLNPAMTYLRARDAAHLLDAMGSSPFVTIDISRSDATRRFVKSRN